MFDKTTGKAIADVLTLEGEVIEETKPYEIFDPVHIWKRKTISNFYAKKLLVQAFKEGKCVYESPDIQTIKRYCQEQINTLWDEVLRLEYPHKYYVDLSQPLWELKNCLLKKYTV